ncbi:MAG: hypothetical protein ACOCW2_02625 [Chitinivibrionales bacterium]
MHRLEHLRSGLLSYPVTQHKATISRAISFFIDVRQHGLPLFTFNRNFTYWNSLGRAYIYYPLTVLAGVDGKRFAHRAL